MRRASSYSGKPVRRSLRSRVSEPARTTNTNGQGRVISSWPLNPRVKHRHVEVTARRTKIDFVSFVTGLLATVYATAVIVHVVLDNLNTHFRKTFVDVLGEEAAATLLERVQFHYTPKHASWLNMAEIEIGIMDRQCTRRRIATADLLQAELALWQHGRNAAGRGIEWKFTRQEADRKLCRHYVS